MTTMILMTKIYSKMKSKILINLWRILTIVGAISIIETSIPFITKIFNTVIYVSALDKSVQVESKPKHLIIANQHHKGDNFDVPTTDGSITLLVASGVKYF